MIRIRSVLIKISFILIFSAFSATGFAQLSMGAKSLGMGQVATALPGYKWAIFSNPSLIDNDEITVGFYGLRNYGFAELTDMAAFGSLPTKFGVASLSFHRYGYNLFNETKIRVGYKNQWQNLHFGMAANYSHIKFGGNYGSGGALGLNIGIAAQITSDLLIGAKALNVNMPEYKGINEDLARELAVGFSYKLNDLALFAMDVVKDVRFPVSYRGGVEIKVVENVKGRVGVSTTPLTYSFGFGYALELFEINVAVQKHTLLGFSPGLDLLLFF